ncbi:hypothetical protein BC829DRAFT_129473 [Chytridium lagenaria]|nr:hypothetical protein BC829DRAFT_129473 [Chytridium lagenaria]
MPMMLYSMCLNVHQSLRKHAQGQLITSGMRKRNPWPKFILSALWNCCRQCPDALFDAYYLISQVMEAKGMLDQSLKLKSDCISIAESFGDHAFIRKMLVSSTYTMLDLAEFDNVKEKCRLLVSLAFSDDDHLSRALSFSASIFCSIMTDDIEQSRLEARALSEILPKTATTRKSIILGALCIFHARAGEFQAAMKFLSDLANHSENVQTHSLVSMKA